MRVGESTLHFSVIYHLAYSVIYTYLYIFLSNVHPDQDNSLMLNPNHSVYLLRIDNGSPMGYFLKNMNNMSEQITFLSMKDEPTIQS